MRLTEAFAKVTAVNEQRGRMERCGPALLARDVRPPIGGPHFIKEVLAG